MPSFSKTVQVPGKTSQELYDRISTEIDRFLEKASVGKYDLTRDASKKEIHVKASMVTATLSCQEGSMVLDAKLSLLAAPFKGKLEEGIDRWVSKTFQT